MSAAWFCAGLLLVLVVLWETFETIVLPRSVIRRLRLTRLYFLLAWGFYRVLTPRKAGPLRESYLSTFGPLSLLAWILVWVLALILGFALMQWGLGSHVVSTDMRPGLPLDLYISGTTFFTLGLGDVVPADGAARFCTVCEAGVGLGFLAIVIGYVPVIYASFSRRETGISLLDARAGSPPTAGEMLLRHGKADSMFSLVQLLGTFEAWASDVMESHLSYPVAAFYRSQHDRESWISALTATLDTCALILAGIEDDQPWQKPLHWQARMTFAMCRHAVVDLSLVLFIVPSTPRTARLSPAELEELRTTLREAGIKLARDPAADLRLTDLRAQYEPYVCGLADRLLMTIPPWIPEKDARDNWQTSAWEDGSHL